MARIHRTVPKKISSLLSIYPDKTVIQNDTCTATFTAALFTIAKTWKQSIYIVYIYTCVHTHNGISLSHKKNKRMPFAAFGATRMDLETVILSEVRQRQVS